MSSILLIIRIFPMFLDLHQAKTHPRECVSSQGCVLASCKSTNTRKIQIISKKLDILCANHYGPPCIYWFFLLWCKCYLWWIDKNGKWVIRLEKIHCTFVLSYERKIKWLFATAWWKSVEPIKRQRQIQRLLPSPLNVGLFLKCSLNCISPKIVKRNMVFHVADF